MKSRFILLIVSCFLLAACNLPDTAPTASDQDQIDTVVAVTVQALTEQVAPVTPGQLVPTFTETLTLTLTITPTPTPDKSNTPEPGFGSISGSILGYSYGSIPKLAIVAHEQNPPYHYWYLITSPGDSYFSMDGYISSGRYQVVAYDYSGHAGGCSSLVEVKNNQMVSCDISNWGGSYPAKPAGVP